MVGTCLLANGVCSLNPAVVKMILLFLVPVTLPHNQWTPFRRVNWISICRDSQSLKKRKICAVVKTNYDCTLNMVRLRLRDTGPL